MHPILFEFSSWQIRSYDAILCLAILVCATIVWLGARNAGFPKGRLLLFLIGIPVFAILGARINGWFFWYGWKTEMLDLQLTATGKGMTAFGGLIGAVCFIWIYAKLNRWNTWILLDLVIPIFALGESIQRIGCFLNGCCYGRVANGLGAFYLPDIFGIWTHRYPSQILTAIFCALLFVYLWQRRKNTPFPGVLVLQYLIFYNIGRLILDFLRGDEPLALGLLSAHQLAAAIIAMAAAIALIIALERHSIKERKIKN